MTTTQTSTLANVVKTAYDRLLYFDLRSQPTFDMVCDVKPAMQAMPGSSVVWSILSNLSAATSTLTETSDITPVALSNPTQVTATLGEYGNGVELSTLLRATGFIDVDEGTLNVLGYNMADSIDTVAVGVLDAGTNVIYSGAASARNTLTPNNVIKSTDLRNAVAQLRTNKAVPKKQGFYVGFVHPHVSYDIRSDTSASANTSWREAHVYASPEAVYAGEIGALEGVALIETPRAPEFLNAGSSPTTTNVFGTLICGQQALAKAVAIDPHLVQSPVTDRLRRIVNYGWYALLGYAIFRQNAVYRIESAATLN